MQKIGPPSRPWRGYRGTDSRGAGNFGASRSGGMRLHKGVDFLALPGDDAVSPIQGTVVKIGVAYSDSTLGSIHIKGSGDYWPYYCKILYARPDDVEIGHMVRPGQKIGIVQNVAGFHGAEGRMKNHLHVELTILVDVAEWLVDINNPQREPNE